MQFTQTRRVAETPERAFDVFSDHAGWQRWSGVHEVVVRQEGDPAPNGLGAIRVMRSRGLAVEEEIVAFERPERLGLRLVGGLPVRDHSTEVTFTPCEGGTELRWTVRFRPWIPGTGRWVGRLLEGQVANWLERFDRAAL